MIETLQANCPYCGERIELVVDTSQGHHEYTEDCEVCCRPMIVRLTLEAGEAFIDVRAEQDG